MDTEAVLNEVQTTTSPVDADERRLSLDEVLAWGRNPQFQLVMLAIGALIFAFLPFFKLVWRQWMDMDSHYAHGLLVPLCSGFLVWTMWPKIKDIPVKGTWVALVGLVPILGAAAMSMRLEQPFIQSVLCIAAIWLSVVLVAGWRWAWALTPAIAYLILGFPILDRIIDRATLPLQQVSTEVAYQILDVLGYKPFRTDSVTINLDKFTLFVAAACSGLKTTIAISAAVVFFMIISRLQFFANLILATIAIPLSVFINGVRIAMIGMVGNEYGEKAGHDFHDYSGYIALALCFYLLYLITKGLEFKKKS